MHIEILKTNSLKMCAICPTLHILKVGICPTNYSSPEFFLLVQPIPEFVLHDIEVGICPT